MTTLAFLSYLLLEVIYDAKYNDYFFYKFYPLTVK